MTQKQCSFEDAVSTAIRDDAWAEKLRDHVATCEACAETAMVTAALSHLSESMASDAIPPASAAWKRAQIQQRLESARRATMPITIMMWVAAILGGGLVAGGMIWLLPSLRSTLGGATLIATPDSLLDAAPVAVIVATFVAIAGIWLADYWADDGETA
jgi:hypothetical protein